MVKNIFKKSYIDSLSRNILSQVVKLEKKYKDYHDICNIIMDGFEKSCL